MIIKSNISLESIHPYSEREVYQAFLEMDKEKTKDWIVYYSCFFKRRDMKYCYSNKFIKNNNEIDFLILAPNVGIFVLEVKGGNIRVRDGLIEQQDRNTGLWTTPFPQPYEQAKINFYSLCDIIKLITNEQVKLDKYIFGTLVAFPDITTLPPNRLSGDNIDTFVGGMDLYQFIMNNSKYLINADRQQAPDNTYDKRLIVPTKSDIDQIVKVLSMADFSYSKSAQEYIESIDLSLSQLTEEQKAVFNGLLENDRCLVEGRAGTGKTVLCQFLFKKLTLEKKLNVIYFTFNELIAESVNSNLEQATNSRCVPLFKYLEDMYINEGKQQLPEFQNYDDKKEFLLFKVNDLLNFAQDEKKYDCLIIDEAQDIEGNFEMLAFFNELLINGLEYGKCYIFYDGNQTIFDTRKTRLYESPEFKDYRYAKFSLYRNCRNIDLIENVTFNILEKQVKKVSTLNVNNASVKLFRITESENGALRVIKEIDNLIEEKVLPKQITILFNLRPNNNKNKIFTYLQEYYDKKLQEYKPVHKTITYSTVSRFKGLD